MDTPPIPPRRTLPDLLAWAGTTYPNRFAFRLPDGLERLTFAEVDTLAGAAADWLRRQGIGPGDRVCLLSQSLLDCILLFHGAARLGAVAVPVDGQTGSASLGYVLNHCEPSLVFCDGEGLPLLRTLSWPECKTVPLSASDPLAFLGEAERADAPPAPEAPPGPDDLAVLLYTSGSTGHPKGVMLSHGALCRSGALLAGHYRWTPDDVFLNLASFHTMSGLRNTAVTSLYSGSEVLLTPPEERDSVFRIVDSVASRAATLLGCAPIFVRQLALFEDRLPAERLATLRAILCTGSMLDPDIVRRVYGRYGIPTLNYYGLTETTGFCAGHREETFLQNDGGIGFPVGAVLEIADEVGKPVPDGTEGELAIRGPNLMLGYYRQPELTAGVLEQGCFRTGDTAVRRPSGEIVLVGRKKNFIKTALSELVHFEEVELALEQHPGVREAAVRGFTSSLGDERLAAFVVPSTLVASEEAFFSDLVQFLSQLVGRGKAPAAFLLRETLPRNSAGKLLRHLLEGP